MEGKEKAVALAQDLLTRYDDLLSEKNSINEQLVADAPVIKSPRSDLDRIFANQNLCLDMMTLDVPGVARAAVGGLQGFAWFFGCDSYYTVDGLIVAGQAQTARGNLDLLGSYAAKQNGRVPHEITQTGTMFNPGNTLETPEFVTAVERTFRWTGDKDFLARLYPVCRTGIFDYVLGECDPQQQLLPDGAGLLELSTAHHGKKLDVACSLYQGLQSLAYLASAAGDQETADKAAALTTQVRDQINAHFWLPARQEYVWRIEPDLSAKPDEPAHTYAVLEMGLLDDSDRELVDRLFTTVEGPAHTGPRGVIHPGTKDFVMPIQNAIVALAEFRLQPPG